MTTDASPGTDPADPHAEIELAIVDGVATATLGRPGPGMNLFTPQLAMELDAIIARCRRPDVKAVVITSARPDNFLAGADVNWLVSLETADAAVALLTEAHRILADLESLSSSGTPVVAAIHGICLGGGLELALACSIRVVSDDDATRLGLPEVKLGILPGAGGTQRLPRLIGLTAALDMMLTGRALRPGAALEVGLVDEVVPQDRLLDVARSRALQAATASPPTRRRSNASRTRLTSSTIGRRVLEGTRLGRRILFSQVTKQTRAAASAHYPAPPTIIRVVRTGAERGLEAGYAAERDAFGTLLMTPVAHGLLRVFTDSESLRHATWTTAEPRPVDKVGIIGGGLMGGGIAAVTAAEAELRVRIKEVDETGARRGLAHVRRHLDRQLARRRRTEARTDVLMQQVTASTDFSGFADVDVVIEAVFEDLELKRSMLAEVENVCGHEVIFASNTSSIPIAAIAADAQRPEHVVGMHYFSPVERMPLLEVVVTESTADWVTETAVALGRAQGKTAIVVRDGPGFYTTRVLGPYLNEICHLIGEGVPIDEIDHAMVAWGFPIGPVALMDEVGIDVGAKIVDILADAFGPRMTPPDNFARLLADERRGRKNGRGFYLYEDGKRQGVDPSVYDVLGAPAGIRLARRTLRDRLITVFVNEAARCLEEGIITSPRDGDVGAVLGLGFPPFRGGPFTYTDQVGAADIVTRLDNFAKVHGERYAAADILRRHAASGEKLRP